jgi:hypothetical protein
MYTVEIIPTIIQVLLPVIIKIFQKTLVGLRQYLNAVMIWSNTVVGAINRAIRQQQPAAAAAAAAGPQQAAVVWPHLLQLHAVPELAATAQQLQERWAESYV